LSNLNVVLSLLSFLSFCLFISVHVKKVKSVAYLDVIYSRYICQHSHTHDV
jgi:hypothetical protein